MSILKMTFFALVIGLITTIHFTNAMHQQSESFSSSDIGELYDIALTSSSSSSSDSSSTHSSLSDSELSEDESFNERYGIPIKTILSLMNNERFSHNKAPRTDSIFYSLVCFSNPEFIQLCIDFIASDSDFRLITPLLRCYIQENNGSTYPSFQDLLGTLITRYFANIHPEDVSDICFLMECITIDKASSNCWHHVFITAAKTNNILLAECLLKKSILNVNFKDREGMTALMYAAINGNASLIQVLLANNANTSLRNNDNYTAHDLTMLFQHKDSAELLATAL